MLISSINLSLFDIFIKLRANEMYEKLKALGRFNHSPISTELSSVRYNKKKKKSVSPRFSEPYVYLNNETKKILLTTTHSHVQYIELLWLIIVSLNAVLLSIVEYNLR